MEFLVSKTMLLMWVFLHELRLQDLRTVGFSNCVDEARIIYRIIAKAELAEPIETQPQLT